jgi:hypothetical protein
MSDRGAAWVAFATIAVPCASTRVRWELGEGAARIRRLSKGGGTSVDADHSKYDNPEPSGDKSGKAAMFVVGALAVALVLFLLSTGRVQIFH